MFCSNIRSRNGWNNNPNLLQLKWALRALLMKNNIEASKNANCIIEDIPYQNSSFCVDDSLKAILDSSAIWKDDVLFYISGFISQSLKKLNVPNVLHHSIRQLIAITSVMVLHY